MSFHNSQKTITLQTEDKSGIHGLASVGRLAVVVLLLIQCGFLTAFPVWYTGDLRWIPVAILYAPAVVYWMYREAKLVETFFTWSLYVVIALVPHVAITSVLCGDNLDKDNFLGPNCLKATLCITPLVFLVLMNAASDLGDDNSEYRKLASMLSVLITIDLFDGVEMLDTVLDEKEHAHGIPKGFGIAMISVACLSFLLSLVRIAKNELDNGSVSTRNKVAIIGNVFQIILLNLPFMVMRLVLFFKYKKDETIFIAKNGIAIFISFLVADLPWIKTETPKRITIVKLTGLGHILHSV